MLMMAIFVGCTEMYVPKVDSDTKALVVEGLITDGAGPFTIKLTEALPYASDSDAETSSVSDAKLSVSDDENHIYNLTNEGKGKYTLPSTFKAKAGNSYTLHIETSDGSIYESSPQKLLSPQSYDSIHASSTTREYLDDDNVLNSMKCFDVRLDLFNAPASEAAPLCRFKSNAVIQYEYTYTLDIDPETDTIPTWYWDIFGWDTFQLDEEENITEERSNTGNPIIYNHLLSYVPMGTSSYGITTSPSVNIIYYFRFDQYTINEETYNFYKEANNQLAASGKLFDPITSQLYGNMKCTSNPSKIVLGLFEVSSVTQAAYVIKGTKLSNKVTLRKVPYLDIPQKGSYRYKVNADESLMDSVATLPDYQVVKYPVWWTH